MIISWYSGKSARRRLKVTSAQPVRELDSLLTPARCEIFPMRSKKSRVVFTGTSGATAQSAIGNWQSAMLDDWHNFKPLAIAVMLGCAALWLIAIGWWLGRHDVLLTFREHRRQRRQR